MTSSSTEEQLLRRLEDLEKREKDRQRDELLKAAFAAQLEKVRAETERKEERMRAEMREQGLLPTVARLPFR